MSSTTDLLNTTATILGPPAPAQGLDSSFDSTALTSSKINQETPKPQSTTTSKKKHHFRRHCYSEDFTIFTSTRSKSTGYDSSEENYVNSPAFLSPKRKREQNQSTQIGTNSGDEFTSIQSPKVTSNTFTKERYIQTPLRNKNSFFSNLENNSDEDIEAVKSTNTVTKGFSGKATSNCQLHLPPGTVRKSRRRNSSGKFHDVDNSLLPPVSSKATPRSQRNRAPSSFSQTPFRSKQSKGHQKKVLSDSFSVPETKLQTPALTPKLCKSLKVDMRSAHNQKNISSSFTTTAKAAKTPKKSSYSLVSPNDTSDNQVGIFTFGCSAPVQSDETDSNNMLIAKNASFTSSCTSSPPSTPFRFSSFPASLPRINNPRFCAQPTNQKKMNEPNLHTPRSTSPTVDLTRSYQSPFFGSTHDSGEKPGQKLEKRKTNDHLDLRTWEESPVKNDPSYFNHGLSKTPYKQLALSSVPDISHDDTQNTSISSLSVEGHQSCQTSQTNGDLHRPYLKSHIKNSRKEAVWLSPVQIKPDEKFDKESMHSHNLEKRKEHEDSDGGSGDDEVFRSPVHAKLFADESVGEKMNYELSCDSIDSSENNSPVHSLGGELIGRTRLNFNSLLSPGPLFGEDNHTFGNQKTFRDIRNIDTDEETTPTRNKIATEACEQLKDISRSFDHVRSNSFPSVSTHSSFKNISFTGHNGNDTEGTFTPFRDQRSNKSLMPQEVHFRFNLDATQCSPIANSHDDHDMRQAGSPLLNTTPKSETSDMELDNQKLKDNFLTPNSNSLESSANNTSRTSAHSDSSSCKTKKTRPMPDMSAFDIGTTSSNGLNSTEANESSQLYNSGVSGSQQSPVKLVCPPTPVRTPAWAHNGIFTRTDSLISSKVLAACNPQILDGLSSLETSLLEDEPDSQNSENVQNTGAISSCTSCSAVIEETAEDILQHDNSNHNYKINRATNNSLLGSATTYPMSNTDLRNKSCSASTKRLSSGSGEVGSSISFDECFENLGNLGRGSFADVFKVRSKTDKHLYAIKRHRRQFRGKRDRERAMAEVRVMQHLQSFFPSSNGDSEEKSKNSFCLYILFFICAWQEDGYFFCQTELCCRDTCRQMIHSLRSNWNTAKNFYPSLLRHFSPNNPTPSNNIESSADERLLPETSIWKICHDVSAGLSHIHSHGIVHHDIKPDNIFFVLHARLGTLCKIGDFGMAGEIGTNEDGQEGDTVYMPQELLSCAAKQPSGDIFSFGLTLYELSSSKTLLLPAEGPKWHEIRSRSHFPELPLLRSKCLGNLIRDMIQPDVTKRPTADQILNVDKVIESNSRQDTFLTDYVHDVENFDQMRERENFSAQLEANQSELTPKDTISRDRRRSWSVRTPTPNSSANYHSLQSKR